MITRLSKIARLPANIREEINHRLHNGELSRTIIPWINELPETKKVMVELCRGKPVTHQNLSEWRHTGYQDWLLHQQRLEWNGRLAEEEAEVTQQNRCEDGYEAMGFQFLYEIAQALKTMQKIKNPNHRWDRLETLTREFCRLQNAFNWSRRVALEFNKFKRSHPVADAVSKLPNPEIPPATNQSQDSTEASAASPSSFCILPSALPDAGGASVPASRAPALQDPSRNIEASAERASVSDCGSPLPLSEVDSQPSESPSPDSDLRTPNSNLPPPINSSTPTPFQPLPTLAPPTPPPPIPTPNSYLRTPRPPIRGRRFICIEG